MPDGREHVYQDEFDARWAENLERRVGIVEKKVDDILHPVSGLWPHIAKVKSDLKGWAIGILVALLLNLLGMVMILILAPWT